MKFKVNTKVPSQDERKKGYSERDESSVTHVYEVNQAQFLRIPQFSGDDPPQKGDVSYKEWGYEVQCLRNDPAVKKIECKKVLKGYNKANVDSIGGES